jgi:putative polyhydroxyalkanoate system protein
MAKISITRSHALGLAGAKQAIDTIGADLAAKYQVTHQWAGNTLKVSRSGLDGTLEVTDTTVIINLNLGFLLSAVKGQIENAINAELDQRLTATV